MVRKKCGKAATWPCKAKDNINHLTPNDPYRGRTAPLTSKRCILCIYSTSIGTEYFKHGIYSQFFFSLQNAVCFIILTYLFPVLFTFYTQCALKLKKIIPAPKGRMCTGLRHISTEYSGTPAAEMSNVTLILTRHKIFRNGNQEFLNMISVNGRHRTSLNRIRHS